MSVPVASINDLAFEETPRPYGEEFRVSVAPNPFNPRTVIHCRLSRSGPVEIQVLDVRGQLVARLHDGVLGAGEHEFTWSGRDQDGTPVSSGAYFARVRTDQGTQHQKMMLIK